MVDFEAPINKVITIMVITICFPMALIAYNGMNTTGFDTTQLAISTLLGFLIAIGFLKIVIKE